jgi:hypothetical protein
MSLLFSPYLRATDQSNAPIPGAFLSFYATQTSTPQPIYADFNLTIPLQNPTQADGNGVFPQIWLDDSLPAYKVALQYPDVNDPTIPGAIVAGPNGTIDPYNSGFNAAALYADLAPFINPRTNAERNAGVVPVNFGFAPGVVDRYGTNTIPGSTDMTAAFQAAINQTKQIGGSAVSYGRTGWYKVSGPLDCTTAGQPTQQGVVIRCTGGAGHDLAHGIFSTAVSGVVFDATGSDSFYMDSVNICTAIGLASGSCPVAGILWARNASGGSTIHRLHNVKIVGSFSNACFYNYGCEDTVLTGCYLANYCTSSNTRTRVYTASNVGALTSSFTPIMTGAVSMTDHTVIGCQDLNVAGTTTSDCVFLEGIDGYISTGGWAYSASPTANGRALIYIDQSSFGSARISINGLKGETSNTFLQQYGILVSNHAATLSGLTVDGCFLPNASLAIATVGATAVIDNARIRAVSEQASHGFALQGVVQNSFIEGINILAIGTSRHNTLIGLTENWTITTRDNDYWIDQGVTNKSWTPALGTATHGGTLTINENRFLLNGNQADFEFVITDTTSITATAAQTITGLPFAAARRSASVMVANATTGLAIGAAFIDAGATSIKMPAFTVGAGVSVCVSGRYFVA